MATTEIIWRTHHGDLAGVTVHDPEPDSDLVRLVIGHGFTLRVPATSARLLAQALTDAADMPPAKPAPRVIPIQPAPGPALYHEPEEESHV